MPKTCSSCHCCPYGFHIDRDFVQYCESLYNIAQLDKLKQKKRERRREQMTVESCLGLNTQLSNGSDDNKTSLIDAFSNMPTEGDNLCDLDGVMSDFEDTWQESVNRKMSSREGANDSVNKIYETSCTAVGKTMNSSSQPISSVESVPHIALNHLCSHKSKESSVSCSILKNFGSIQPAVYNGFSSQNELISHGANKLVSQEMAATMDTLSQVGLSHDTVGIHRDVLTNIREQMATSLKRMKELEEQVKSIPLLQVKLSALNEEKNMLLHELKMNCNFSVNLNKKDVKEQVQRLHDEGILTPRLSTKSFSGGSLTSSTEDLTSPAIASNLNDVLVKRCFVDSEIISQLKFDENGLYSSDISSKTGKDKDFKNVGTWCSVLTRDIGVGHIQSKCKSTGVGEESVLAVPRCFRCLQEKGTKQSVSVSSESLESDSDSAYDAQNSFSEQKTFNRFPGKYVKTMPTLSTSHKPSSDAFTITELKVKQASTITDLHMSDVISCIELEKKKKLRKNKSTSCDFPIKSSKAVQVPLTKLSAYDRVSLHVAVQTSDSLVLACSSEKNSSNMRHVGIGDFNISDILCLNCSKKSYRSISVGECSVSGVICDKCSNKKMVSVGCGLQSVSDVHCNRCELRQTETVGVGDSDINQLTCILCTGANNGKMEKMNNKPVMMQSVSVNTSASITLCNSSSGINICDKCSAAAHSGGQDFVSGNSEAVKPHETADPKLIISVSGSKESTLHHNVQKAYMSSKKPSELSCVKQVTAKISEEPKSLIISAITNSSGPKDPTHSTVAEKNYRPHEEETTDGKRFSEAAVNPFKVIQHKRVELSKEVKAACKVLSDYLQKPDRRSEKTLTSLNIIKNEWFQVANQKTADPHVIEGYLDAFEEFSRPLLQRIVNLADNNGNTAVHYAVSYSNFDVVSILVDSKVCDVNKQNKAGYTCIMLVALAEVKNDTHNYVVQRLFQMGDINIKAKQNGQTALMLAVSHGKVEIVRMLLEAGAEVNLQDNDGSTALMCAAEHGHIDIVQILLSHPDCDPTILDSDGSNALSIAMEAGHKDIGLLIYADIKLSRGSSPHLKQKRRSSSRSTPPPRTPTLWTPSSPSARSTSSLPSVFHFIN